MSVTNEVGGAAKFVVLAGVAGVLSELSILLIQYPFISFMGLGILGGIVSRWLAVETVVQKSFWQDMFVRLILAVFAVLILWIVWTSLNWKMSLGPAVAGIVGAYAKQSLEYARDKLKSLADSIQIGKVK